MKSFTAETETETPLTGGVSAPPTGLGAGSNRHPVDELADVRAEIAALKARADLLRDKIISGDCTLDGWEFEASIRTQDGDRLDTKALRKAMGDNAVRAWLRPTTTTFVTLRRQSDADT